MWETVFGIVGVLQAVGMIAVLIGFLLSPRSPEPSQELLERAWMRSSSWPTEEN